MTRGAENNIKPEKEFYNDTLFVHVRFTVRDLQLRADDTPSKLGLVDGDLIDVTVLEMG